MTRVLQAMAGAVNGGAEAFFDRLAPALGRAGVAQRLVIRREPGRAARLRAASLAPAELRFGGRLDLTTRRSLAREIEGFAPDIVLTWMSRATRLCPRGRFVHAARLGGYYGIKYFRACDHLIGNTKDIVDYLVSEGWPAARAHYLPNFVDDAASEPVARGSLETPEDAPLFLALGRLHPNKAFDVLLDALAEVPGAWLWIAGDGPLLGELAARADRLGLAERVRFLGWRQDAGALLAAVDVLVCPSRLEPLGNVVIEGWARHRPVVAAAGKGPAALIEHEENGLLVPIDDAPALAAAMARVIGERDLRAGLVAAGRAAFEEAYTEKAVVARYLDFFDRVTR